MDGCGGYLGVVGNLGRGRHTGNTVSRSPSAIATKERILREVGDVVVRDEGCREGRVSLRAKTCTDGVRPPHLRVFLRHQRLRLHMRRKARGLRLVRGSIEVLGMISRCIGIHETRRGGSEQYGHTQQKG